MARTLGYHVDGPHRAIIRHQNRTAYGPDRSEDMVLGFRGLGKSTVGTIVRAIKYLIDNPNCRILFVSDGQTAAERFLREVRAHLENNQDLIDMFGPAFHERSRQSIGRYREDYATVLWRTDHTISEPSIFCLGIGGQGASYHYDVIILDDLVTIRNSKTPKQRQNVDDWHGSTLIGCSLPHTRTHYLGTRYFPHDQYDKLERGGPDESEGALAGAVLKIQAIVKDVHGEERSSYPQRFSLEKLHRMRKRMGRYHFNAQMQQDTASGEGIIFNYADFQWYNYTNESPPPRRADGSLDLTIYQFSDLTAKKTDTGAFFACVTIGVTQDQSKVYVLDLVRERAGMAQQRKRIVEAAEKWKPYQAGIEAVAMQAGFAEELQESSLLPFIPVKVESDKVFRARRVQHLFEAHKVYFPLDDMPQWEAIQPMLEELTQFPDSEFVDTVDSIVGALTMATLGGPEAASPVYEEEEGDDGDDGRYRLRGTY